MSAKAAATPTQLELSALPTFHLLLLVLAPPTPQQAAGLKTLLDTLFGISLNAADLFSDVTAGRPVTSPLNTRISFTLLASPAAARERVDALAGRPLQDQIHAVWVVLPHDPARPNDVFELRAPANELLFPVETLLLVPSATRLPEATATTLSVALRRQGLPQAIVHFAPSLGPPEVARVSQATEALYVPSSSSLPAHKSEKHAGGSDAAEDARVVKRLVWVAAQRVNRDEKIATAVSKGMKMFSVAVGASAQPIPFVGGATGVTAIGLLNKDLMDVYNFNDEGHILKSKAISSTVYEAVTGLPLKWAVSLVGLSWVSGLWEAPGSARTIMTAIADLTLILDALFVNKLAQPSTGTSALTADEVKAVVKQYEAGPSKPSLLDKVTKRRSTEASAVRNALFSRELVHQRLGKENISTFNVWKSLKRHEAQAFLEQVIREHRYSL